MSPEEMKRAGAVAALAYLPESGVVGLGTGSTVKYFIEGVAELVRRGRRLSCVPTSEASRSYAESLGVPLLADVGPWDIDVCVDGADEVDQALNLIKGGGGAHTREKIVNDASKLRVIVIDESKLSTHLGERWAVPIEVVSFGHRATAAALRRWGSLALRLRDGSAFHTDNGNLIYDLTCGPIVDAAGLDGQLRAVPGVVETGLFVGRTDVVLASCPDGVRALRTA